MVVTTLIGRQAAFVSNKGPTVSDGEKSNGALVFEKRTLYTFI